MLAALAFLLMAAIQIPVLPQAPYLTYDPSDAVALLAGVLYGPGAGVTVVALKDLLFLLLRAHGPFGPAADFLAAATFVWVTAWTFGAAARIVCAPARLGRGLRHGRPGARHDPGELRAALAPVRHGARGGRTAGAAGDRALQRREGGRERAARAVHRGAGRTRRRAARPRTVERTAYIPVTRSGSM